MAATAVPSYVTELDKLRREEEWKAYWGTGTNYIRFIRCNGAADFGRMNTAIPIGATMPVEWADDITVGETAADARRQHLTRAQQNEARRGGLDTIMMVFQQVDTL